MLKNILNLKGTQELSKKEQTTINGGHFIFTNVRCNTIFDCIDVGDRCYKTPEHSTGWCVIF
ncbi:hypothetical protein [Tenacibaculum sp. M341]|uniref:hypothetical protein n=1 Tax=Tenacibaculum sp. M341 TaxID=2530339 RepID=UPI0010503826|nr:hypothetical protein [Tenacibaculum sp. M341]TCI84472.1 hypothetical protein EYW44_21235 [Tenacibaculum sp. M341]